MSNFGAILTNAGAAKLSNAIALGVPLKLTQMAVGDGNGQPVTPDPAMAAIPGEKRRAAINTLFPDPLAASQLVAEQIIPEDVGGWWIRCVGLYDDSNTLIAIANVPDTYKPLLASGAGRTQIIRMVLIVSDTNSVELKIDPAVVLATRKYVDDVMAAHKLSRDHPDASELAKGFSRFATQAEVDDAAADDVAVTPKKLNQHYKRKNILGAVSQVAGIPTGAIIERGSNANGEYIKFADGTMICWRTYTDTSYSSMSDNGSYIKFISSISMPVVFSSTPVSLCFPIWETGESTMPRWCGNAGQAQHSSTWNFVSFTSAPVSNITLSFGMVAFGRWN
ncbi:phage tail protein [Aeromonas sp. FDAARGOS 1417]|uniref:phage tail protein n=1 Tax=Aeromonas TaxID=642 RepID=UPI001C22B573|nr:phage tail protein [Aeromonas sp. FDAARGOS 1417]QWZ63568.1 phage tail protein [Aeromonas sp. FDAARGOS 1417]